MTGLPAPVSPAAADTLTPADREADPVTGPLAYDCGVPQGSTTDARPQLLDVDGPLNPFAAKPHRRPAGYLTHRMKPDNWIAQHDGTPERHVKPLRVWLNPAHGPALMALPYDIVWATTWEHDANDWIGWRIGFPREQDLPVIEFGDQTVVRPDGTYFKTWTVVDWAAGRPFAWVDDQIGDLDRAYVDRRHCGPALLHWVDPRKGLTEDDLAVLADWAARISTQNTNRTAC